MIGVNDPYEGIRSEGCPDHTIIKTATGYECRTCGNEYDTLEESTDYITLLRLHNKADRP